VLGDTGAHRIDALVHDLVETSEAAGDVVQGERAGEAMNALRTFMFDHVYLGPAARREHAKIERVIVSLFDYFCEHRSSSAATSRRRSPTASPTTSRA